MDKRRLEDLLPGSGQHEPGGLISEVLASLPEDQVQAIGAIAEVRDLERGAQVVAEGDRSPEIGYLLQGALGMQKCLPDGRTHIIGLLVPTDMFGRLFDGPSGYDIVALTEARVLTFPRAPFEAILQGAPEIERLFLVHVLDELDSAREWILLMGGRRIVERVASFLLILFRRKLRVAAHHGRAVSPTIRIPIRRSDLAHYLGTTPESVSRALHELEHDGVLRLVDAYEIEVADLAGLVRISGADHLAASAG